MRKMLAVAAREYSAAVKSKSFIISLILLPIFMGGGLIAQGLARKIGDTATRRVAIIDRTPGQSLYDAVAQAVRTRNEKGIHDEKSGRQIRARFELEKIEPADLSDQHAVDRQRLELSQRVRSGELLAFVEIGQDMLKPKIAPTPQAVLSATRMSQMNLDERLEAAESLLGDNNLIRYSSNRPTYRDFIGLLETSLPKVIYEKRMLAAGVSALQVLPLLTPPRVATRGLAEQRDGKITYEPKAGQIAAFLVPIVLLVLMFMIVMVGASPLTANIIEEKQLRIAEVLLGSLRPFELMMGKLIGGVGTALTLGAIYLGGAFWLAQRQGAASYVTPSIIAWFIFFTVLSVMMYGSMFVAAGAAVTNLKEAQTMITPVMLLIVIPMFMLGPLVQDPSSKLGVVMSFFPFSAPLVTLLRVATPPGIPAWQALGSAGVALATTVALVWAAGRIFRVGILLQGQGAKVRELARWVMRG